MIRSQSADGNSKLQRLVRTRFRSLLLFVYHKISLQSVLTPVRRLHAAGSSVEELNMSCVIMHVGGVASDGFPR